MENCLTRQRVSGLQDEKGYGGSLHNSVNALKTVELYTLKDG